MSIDSYNKATNQEQPLHEPYHALFLEECDIYLAGMPYLYKKYGFRSLIYVSATSITEA